MKLTIQNLEIPFKQVFTHATATRVCTETILVKANSENGIVGVGEGCPRQYVTGETIHSAINFFTTHRDDWEEFQNVGDLEAWMAENCQTIDENPASWCAVELALFDCWGQENRQSLESLLNLQELSGQFQYSAVLGTEDITSFKKQAKQFCALDFYDFKVKVTGNLEQDRQKIQFLKDLPIQNIRIRLDANNLWNTAVEVVPYVKSLDHQFFTIEEPLQVGAYEGCRQISQQLGLPIILDESFLRCEQFNDLETDSKNWIVNIRISKMGGILRSLKIAEQAKAKGIQIIIGAQVGETSILTRAALTVANQYREILLAQEGAFGTYLLERDITATPLMFGRGGVLDSPSLSTQPGLGLTLSSEI